MVFLKEAILYMIVKIEFLKKDFIKIMKKMVNGQNTLMENLFLNKILKMEKEMEYKSITTLMVKLAKNISMIMEEKWNLKPTTKKEN